MDEFRCTEPVTLRILQPGLADGEVRYEERSATAVVIENRGYRPEDGASAAFEFLLPGRFRLPRGSRLTRRGTTYDVATVKSCRDLDGTIRALRCTVC